MDIISVALKRHSTKAFDPAKKLTAEEAEKIKTLLQYSPSSTNSQPWHFIVASTEEGKARVAKPRRAPMCLTNAKCWMPLT